LKKYLHILLLILIVRLAGAPALAQNPYDLPMACVGAEESYWVKGFNGISDFEWRLIDPNGNDVPEEFYELVNRGDTIQIYWGYDLPGGIYTFEVIEHSDYGCTGDPYTQYIVLNSPTINIPFDGVPESVTICYGETAELDPGAFESYLWQDGSTDEIYYTGDAGTYQVQLINSIYECTYNEMEVFVNPLPVVWLGNDTVLFGTQTLDLNVYDENLNFYEWYTYNFDSEQWGTQPFSIDESITVEGGIGDQWISVYVTDVNGCSNSDSILIYADNYSNFRIPAAFTPNGDGVNDLWEFPAPKPPDYLNYHLDEYLSNVEVRIFNRWGKLVWESSGPIVPWNGKDLSGRELPMDSYHYLIRIFVEGKEFTYKGSVTIVR